MDRSQSSVIPKDLVEYANAVVPQQDAIHRCPALIVLKEENNNSGSNADKFFQCSGNCTSTI